METMPGSCTKCKMGERYGCVGDVKCRILKEYFTGNVKPPYKDRPDVCPLIKLMLPPNDPLTLEELREMDGEPVWVEVPKQRVAEWCIAKWDVLMGRTRLWCAGGGWFDGRNCGKSLFVYRRKPEGGDGNA